MRERDRPESADAGGSQVKCRERDCAGRTRASRTHLAGNRLLCVTFAFTSNTDADLTSNTSSTAHFSRYGASACAIVGWRNIYVLCQSTLCMACLAAVAACIATTLRGSIGVSCWHTQKCAAMDTSAHVRFNGIVLNSDTTRSNNVVGRCLHIGYDELFAVDA